jgi:restriction system protein
LKAAVPGARRKHDALVAGLRAEYEEAMRDHRAREAKREHQLAQARADFDRRVAERRAEHDADVARVDEFAAAIAARDPGALAEYFGLVLNASHLPEDFPRWHRLAYVPESRQLVVEFQLPGLEVVPTEKSFRYVKARDEITSTARPAKDRKERYAAVLAQLSLRMVHELFEAERPRAVETIVFNGIVNSVDPRTGQNVRPCLITLRTTRERFEELHLGRVDRAIPECCGRA